MFIRKKYGLEAIKRHVATLSLNNYSIRHHPIWVTFHTGIAVEPLEAAACSANVSHKE